jgi:hypothetical protein
MANLRMLGVAALVSAAVSVAACDERLTDLTGPTQNLTPTFSSIQRDIFESSDSSGRPDCTSCHNTQLARFNGGLDLTHAAAYSNLLNAASSDKPGAVRVIPGDPENSYLIHKLEGRPGIVGQRMPISGPFLSPGQIAVIRRWIELGAAND